MCQFGDNCINTILHSEQHTPGSVRAEVLIQQKSIDRGKYGKED